MIELENPSSWPSEVVEVLDANHSLFLAWEQGTGTVSSAAYDAAVADVSEALRPYSIKGWHCTRLTDAEIAAVRANGMRLPDGRLLDHRIDTLVAAGELSEPVAQQLKDENESDHRYRAGMLHFVFYLPHIAGEAGIGRFFRHWGGEALYNSHEDNPSTSAALKAIGTPCVIEADVPISSLGPYGGTVTNVIRRYLISRGYRTRESVLLEDKIVQPLGPEGVLAIHRHPDNSFMALTGCARWRVPV